MSDQLVKKLKGAGYTLETSDVVAKCACLADRLGLTAREFADEFEVFAITRYAYLGKQPSHVSNGKQIHPAQGQGMWPCV